MKAQQQLTVINLCKDIHLYMSKTDHRSRLMLKHLLFKELYQIQQINDYQINK